LSGTFHLGAVAFSHGVGMTIPVRFEGSMDAGVASESTSFVVIIIMIFFIMSLNKST
jgi:hypothetical protein